MSAPTAALSPPWITLPVLDAGGAEEEEDVGAEVVEGEGREEEEVEQLGSRLLPRRRRPTEKL